MTTPEEPLPPAGASALASLLSIKEVPNDQATLVEAAFRIGWKYGCDQFAVWKAGGTAIDEWDSDLPGRIETFLQEREIPEGTDLALLGVSMFEGWFAATKDVKD